MNCFDYGLAVTQSVAAFLTMPMMDARLGGGGGDSIATVQQLMEKTHTQTGLEVTVDVLDKVYEAGGKAAEHLKSALKIAWDAILPKWNYILSPQEAPA